MAPDNSVVERLPLQPIEVENENEIDSENVECNIFQEAVVVLK